MENTTKTTQVPQLQLNAYKQNTSGNNLLFNDNPKALSYLPKIVHQQVMSSSSPQFAGKAMSVKRNLSRILTSNQTDYGAQSDITSPKPWISSTNRNIRCKSSCWKVFFLSKKFSLSAQNCICTAVIKTPMFVSTQGLNLTAGCHIQLCFNSLHLFIS